jgi:hypothetical protein
MELLSTFELMKDAEKGEGGKASERLDTPAPDRDTGPGKLFRFDCWRTENSGIKPLLITDRVLKSNKRHKKRA